MAGNSFSSNCETEVKGGSGNRAPISIVTLRREPGGRVPILRTPQDTRSKTLDMEHFQKGILKNLEREGLANMFIELEHILVIFFCHV
jgi:hypothetical protein